MSLCFNIHTFVNQVWADHGSEEDYPFKTVGNNSDLQYQDIHPNARDPTSIQSLSIKAFNGNLSESEIKGLRFYILLEENPHRFRYISTQNLLIKQYVGFQSNKLANVFCLQHQFEGC